MSPTNIYDAEVLHGYSYSDQFELQAGDGTAFPVGGATWEYVVRASPSDTGTPLVRVTTTPNSQGSITVSTGAKTLITVALTAAATALTPDAYYHALIMNPSDPSPIAWVVGAFVVNPVAQL